MSTPEAIVLFKQTIDSLTQDVRALEIVDEEGKRKANLLLIKDKQAQAQVSGFFDPTIASADKTHKDALAMKRTFFQPLKDLEDVLKKKLTTRILLEQRQKQEAEEKARKEAEDARIANEALLKEAAEKEKAGEKVDTEAVFAQLKEVPPEPPKVPIARPLVGASVKDDWEYRIVDESLIPREYFTLDEAKLRKVVRALKDKTNIPGIEVFRGINIAARAKF